MKTLSIISVILGVAITTLAQNTDVVHNAQSKSIVVPRGNGREILVDGLFSKGEWDNSAVLKIAENYDMYLLTKSEFIFLGLKPSTQKGSIMCDIWITTNGKEMYRLHVSMKLAEGFTSFENYDRKVYMTKTNDWEANLVKETNENVYELNDGVEFKINRKKNLTNHLKIRIE